MNKKLLLTSFLSMSLLLTGCGKKDKPKNVANEDLKIESNVPEENIYFDGEKVNDKKEKEVKVDKVALDELMLESDYITRVKIQVDAENKTTVNFIEDYKGDLSNVEITLPKSLTPSREYLIFYKDGPDGKIMPSKVNESFIEIDGTDDGNLNYIESHYVTKIDDEKDEKNSKSKTKDAKDSKTTKDTTDTKSTNTKSSTTKNTTNTKTKTTEDTKSTKNSKSSENSKTKK